MKKSTAHSRTRPRVRWIINPTTRVKRSAKQFRRSRARAEARRLLEHE